MVYNVNGSQRELIERVYMKDFNEELLDAWLNLTGAINNEKIVSQLPYNEVIICRILYRNRSKQITATDLCEMTKMQKSQMNRTLTSMENKKILTRTRSSGDKRKIYVTLNEEQIKVYEDEHERILKTVDKLIERVGKENAQKALELFELIAHIAKEEIK